MQDIALTASDEKKWKECVEEARKAGVSEKDAGEVGTLAFLKYKCLTDLFFLGYEILGLKNARHGKARLIHPPLHKWLANALEAEGSKMIIIPRDCMKTTWSKIRAVQRILQEPQTVRIAYISRTANLGRAILKSMVRLLMTPALMELFPEVIPPKGKLTQGLPTNWDRLTEDFFTLRRDYTTGDAPQEHQLEVFGMEATITGKHFTDQIYDDPINEETVRSPTQMEKAVEFMQHSVNLLVPGGNETYIGTPYHYADLIAHCINEKYFDKLFKRAIIENGKSIYPQIFTMKEIEKRKKRQGNYIFNCQMMVDPLPKEDLLFPPPQPTYSGGPPAGCDYYISIDPAATTKLYSDYTAFAVCAIDTLGRVWVEDSFQLKKEGQEIARIILELNEKYHPRLIGIEAGLQAHLIGIVQLVKKNWEVSQNTAISLPIEPITITKKDKYDRFNMTIGSWARTGRLKINERLGPLMAQMALINRNYEGHDDLVDAVSLVFQLVPNFGMKMKHVDGEARFFETFETMMRRAKEPVKFADRFSV